MPIKNHPSFNRPPVSARLWRYVDLAKFVDLLTSRRLWLTSAEVLAKDDPYEGLPGPLQFPHRVWKNIDEVPEVLRRQIIQINGKGRTPEQAFKLWFMGQEQESYMIQATRRNYHVSCWHASQHESAAMWKIYGSPGAGVAIVSNGGRMETALSSNVEDVYLGSVQYDDPDVLQIGFQNGFDTLLLKRSSYSYEKEVRLVHWDTKDMHDALANFAWNENDMRFDDVVEDQRPLIPGMALSCDVDVLIERVIVSPYAPAWYLPMIETLRDQLRLSFPVSGSNLLTGPTLIA